MRWRLIKRSIFAIVLGAATTLLIAWACALWITGNGNGLTMYGGPVYPGVRDLITSKGRPAWGMARVVVVGSSPSSTDYGGMPQPYEPAWVTRFELDPSMTYVSDARGWPLLCMRGGFDIDSPDGRGRVVETHWAIILDIRPQIPGRDKTATPILPLEPIWSGFAINTLIYTCIWCVVLTTPGAVRRKIRKSRGSCLECGYDLRGANHDVCPECGGGIDI